MASENIIQETLAPEAQEPEKKAPKKRATITSLKADFKTLESFMDEEIIPAIELIEDRLNKVIEELQQTPIRETPMLETRLQALEDAPTKLQPSFVPDINARMEELERNAISNRVHVNKDILDRLDVADKSLEILHENQASLMKVHLQMQDDFNVIVTNNTEMQDAIIALQEGETAEAPEPHTMANWVQPKSTRAEEIASLARVCVSMSDVLMICRYLKADPQIPEEERIETLHVACQRAGVAVSAGMKARAGVKFIEA